MNNLQDGVQFTVLESKRIGRNLTIFRRLRNKKTFEVADYIGIGELEYTKYERGEAKITVDLVQKVAEFLNIDPITLLSESSSIYIDNVQHSAISYHGNSTYHAYSEQQNQMMLKLLETMTQLSQRMLEIMEKEKR